MIITKSNRKLIAQEAKLKKGYKRARRKLMNHIIWLDPANRMGVVPIVAHLPDKDEFDVQLQTLAESAQRAFDVWSNVRCRLDLKTPKA